MARNNSDEIDLLDITLKVLNAFKASRRILISFFVIGVLLGIAFYAITPKTYQSKLIISSTILTESYGKKLVDNLRQFIAEANYNGLATELGITESEARKIFAVRIEHLSEIETDALKESDRYLITVRLSDQEMLPKLQQGIINYFENNDFVKVRVEQNRNYFTQMIAKIQKEIADLEELKSRIYSGSFFESARGNVSFDPTAVNSKIIELTKEKINLENSLQLVNSVQVIEGFAQFDKPVAPKLAFSIVMGAFVGVVIACAIIGLKYLNRFLREAEVRQAA